MEDENENLTQLYRHSDDRILSQPKLWTVFANRWIRRLGTVQLVALVVAIGWLIIMLSNCPQPKVFESEQSYAEIVKLKDRLIDDLRGKPDVRTFCPEDLSLAEDLPWEDEGAANDYSYIRSLVYWGDKDKHDAAKMEALSLDILKEYQREFSEFRLRLKVLLGTGVVAAICTTALVVAPRVTIAILLLVVSCSVTPVVTEFTIGRDLSELIIYSLPFIVLSLAMFVLAFVGFWSEQFRRNPTTQAAWCLTGFGAVVLPLALVVVVYEIKSGVDLNYRQTMARGGALAAGIWALCDGLRQLIKIRARKR